MPHNALRGIFGRGTREAVLAAVHVLGPATLADLARAVRTDADHASHAVAHFERHGLVRVNRNGANRSYATIDWRSPLYDETRALAARFAGILGLAGEPRFAHRWGVGRGRTEVRDHVGLFGSPTASRILLHVAAAGETDVAGLVAALAHEESLVRDAIARLERDGLLRGRRDGRRRPVSLNPAHPAGTEVAALLRAVLRVNAEHVALADDASRTRRKAAAIPHRDRARRTPGNAAAALLGLIDPRYARALLALAGGPLTGPELTRRLGLSRGAAVPLARTLARAGLVREIRVPGPHVAETAFLLDAAHPAAPELRTLLAAATRRCECRGFAAWLAKPPPESQGVRPRPVGIWPPDYRGRLAVLLAIRGGARTVDELATETGWPRHVARRRAFGLVEAKLAVAALDGAILTLAPDSRHPLATEVDALLRRLGAAGVRPRDLRTMHSRGPALH